jgi:hypothetical protein
MGPKQLGHVLRTLRFIPKRDSKGYAIGFTDEVRRQVHDLARRFDLAAMQEPFAQCEYCAEIFANCHATRQTG